MRGDFSRDTFKPEKQYAGVLMQQGRLSLDADWNEHGDILRHYMRRLARDLIGPHGGPRDDLGFEIIVDAAVLDERLSRAGAPATQRATLLRAIESGAFVIGPGRYYVEGIAIENDGFIAYTGQPGYPLPGSPPLDQLRASRYLVYLDVWERLVTYVEDPGIREVALGGADTTVRSQVIWQVRVLPARAGAPLDPGIVAGFGATGSGRLRARAPSPNRYSGAENRLYRVEIHAGGAAGGATFKWSRRNGADIYPISGVTRRDPTHLVAELAPGAAPSSRLAVDDRVELFDDEYELRNSADPLLVVAELDAAKGLVTLDDAAGRSSVRADGKHSLLRRWDQRGEASLGWASLVANAADQPSPPNWLTLEDGIEIAFSASGDYRTGDYWLIPARPATGDIEWPHERDDQGNTVLGGDGSPVTAALLPRGPKHAYAPLAVRDPNDGLHDYRRELPQARRVASKG